MKKFFLFSFLCFLVTIAFSQPGSLDKTFGDNGYAITTFGGFASLFSIAVQSDGKIVAAGTVENTDFAVCRYNTDGSADNSFGTNGKVITDLGNTESANAVVIQADGKIVVAGYTTTGIYPDILSKIVVVRYNTNGTLDNSFGTGGTVITANRKQTFGYAMALQADGKILVTGSTSDDGNNIDIILLRYNSDGTTDNTFGSAGIVTSSFDFENEAYAVALQPDGKIVIAGYTYDGSSNSTNAALIRYLPNGTLDNSFADGGLATDYAGVASSVAIQADGKILEGGRDYNDDYNFYGYIKRKNADGTSDATYGNYGSVAGGYYSKFTSKVYSLVLQADGKAVASITRKSGYPDYKTSLGVIRLKTTGKADSTFADDGFTSVSNNQFYFNDPPYNPLALNADGKILLGATFSGSFAVARILAGNVNEIDGTQLQNMLNIRAYPNPVASNLFFDGLNKSLPAVLTISDVSGNILKVQKLSAGVNSVNVSTLKQGRYIAVFTQNNKTGSVKFIKQ